MATTLKQKGSLAAVRRHQADGWRLGADCDVDYREFQIVADDLRTLAGRTGHTGVHEANRLCRELLPLAAHRLDVLGTHIGLWQKVIRDRYGEKTLERLKKIMTDKHPEGCPTMADTRAAAKELRACSDSFGEELLLDAVFDDKTFVHRLEKVMNHGAFVIELSIEWLSILIRSVCQCGEEDYDEAL